MLWPFLLPSLLKSKRPLIWLSVGFVVLTLWRTSYAMDFTQSYFRFDTHATGLVMGAALYFSDLRLGRAVGIASLAIFAAIILYVRFSLAFAVIPVAELASAGLIASAASLSFLRNPFLVWLGKRSYAIYLWHFPIAFGLRDRLPFAWTALLTFTLSIGCATLSWHTVEAWGRKMKSGRLPVRPQVSFDVS